MPFFATKSNHAALKHLFSVHTKYKKQQFIYLYLCKNISAESFLVAALCVINPVIYLRLQNAFCICLVFCGGTGVFSHLLHLFSECWYASFDLFVSHLEQTLAQTLVQKKKKTVLLIFSFYWLLQGNRQGRWMAKLIGGGIPEATLEVTAATLNVEVTEICSAWCQQSCFFAGCRWKHQFRLQFLITMKDLCPLWHYFFLTRL